MQIDVSLNGLKKSAMQSARIEDGLKRQAEEIYDTAVELSHSGEGTIRMLSGRLKKDYEDLLEKIRKLTRMREALEKIIAIYEQTELSIEDRMDNYQMNYPVPAMISAEKLLKNPIIVNDFIKLK